MLDSSLSGARLEVLTVGSNQPLQLGSLVLGTAGWEDALVRSVCRRLEQRVERGAERRTAPAGSAHHCAERLIRNRHKPVKLSIVGRVRSFPERQCLHRTIGSIDELEANAVRGL